MSFRLIHEEQVILLRFLCGTYPKGPQNRPVRLHKNEMGGAHRMQQSSPEV